MNWWTSSTTVVVTSNESVNIKHDDHSYVRRITETLKESTSRLECTSPTCAHKPIYAQKTYS